MKNTVKRFDTPKTELNASQKSVPGKRNFLANTNGPEMIARHSEKVEDESQQSQNEKSFKTPLSTDKNIRKKKNLVKTTQLPPKNRTSL